VELLMRTGFARPVARPLARSLGGALVLGALALLGARCFSPTLPDCSYRCGPDDQAACPAEYECREDRYCHLKGSTAACPYTMDLMPVQDLRSAAGDAGPGDGGGDLQSGD
jgi:hypothetical protein